ncbi:transcription factor BYE [Acrasis kona]|uniref:Transcription factor BYE n=1 Tax=Acrasis kona TaxID=1008807 RepID=A0AAW2YX63_9EUKA
MDIDTERQLSPQPIYPQQQPYATDDKGLHNLSTPNSPSDVNQQYAVPAEKGVSPIIVVLLNAFLLPGLGHVVTGQVNKGISMFLIMVLLWALVTLLAMVVIGICLYPVLFVYYIVIIIDGLKIAERQQSGISVLEGECGLKLATYGLSTLGFVKGPIFVTGENPV